MVEHYVIDCWGAILNYRRISCDHYIEVKVFTFWFREIVFDLTHRKYDLPTVTQERRLKLKFYCFAKMYQYYGSIHSKTNVVCEWNVEKLL